MSFSDDFYKALQKEKKKKQNNSNSVSYNTVSVHNYDDIAPVKKGGDKDSWFKSGGFSDGVDSVGDFFGDLGETVLGTAADLGIGVVKGAGRMVEGLTDLGTYGVAGVADLFGADEFAEKTKKVARYNAVDSYFDDVQSYVDQYSVLGNKGDMISEGLGQIGAIILTGGAAGAAGLGGIGTTVVTTGATGLSSMGTNMGEAYDNNATDGEAFLYGLSTGAIEAGTELLFGGLGKGVKALGISRGIGGLDDIFAKNLSRKIVGSFSNETVRRVLGNTIEFSVKSAGEGVEEWLSGLCSAVMKRLTYEDDKTLRELVKDEKLLEQFVVGTIVSGIAQGGDFVKATKSGTDFVTGQTTADEKVVNKVVEDEIARREADGNKLTAKDKNKIYDDVVDRLEKGRIDIDTIDSMFGGEEYKAYKDTVTREDALRAEYDGLGGIENPTLAQQTRYKELHESRDTFINDDMRNDLRKRLDDKLAPMLKNSKLAESYREEARSHQKFKADLTQYKDENARKTIQSIMDSGLANDTNETHEVADWLASMSEQKGVVFNLTDKKALMGTRYEHKGRTTNAYFNEATGDVVLNIDSERPLNSSVGHELGHVLKGIDANLYEEFKANFKAWANSKNGEWDARYKAAAETYAKRDEDGNIIRDENGNIVFINNSVNIDDEVCNDLIGDYIFTNKDFIKHLSVKQPNVFKHWWDEIKYMVKVAKAGTKVEKELLALEKQFADIWRETGKYQPKTAESAQQAQNTEQNIAPDGQNAEDVETDTVQFSIREEAPPKETGIAYKVFFVKDGKLYPPMVANPDGADTPMGVWLNADVGTAAPPSKTGRAQVKAGGKGTQGGSGSLAFRPGWHLGDLPRASQFDRVNPETGKKELFPENFVWAEVEYAKDVDYQEEAMSYGYTENGKFRHAYAGLPRLPENGYYRYRTNPKPDTVPWVITGAMKVNRLLSDAEVNEILEKNGVPAVHRQGGDVGLDKFGFDEKGQVQYSLSSMADTFYGDPNMSSIAFKESDYKQTDGYKNYVDKCLNNMRQTRTDFDETTARKEIEDQIDGIVRVALAAKNAGYDIYDDPTKRSKKDSKKRLLFSSLEPNSDYFTSSDISTICDKRQNFAEIYDDIVRAEEAKGVPKGKRFFDNVDNYFYLHNVLAAKGLTQPCRQCYVESMRKNLAPMANAFLRLVNETDANNKSNDQLYQTSGKNKGQLKTSNAELRAKVLETFEAHPEYGMSVGDLTVETLTTEDGLAQLKIQAPLIYEAFNSFYGQSKPKMPKSATPFRFGELTALLTDHNGKIKRSLVDKINSTGGFRLQSYSDFQIQNYTDVLQVIFEAGTLGLNGHAYTKVPAFLEATEGTNLKRNISIFMYKDGNEWKIDRNDSFPYTLDEIYDIVNSDASGNTSIIAVSQNKEMSAWIMANDYVGQGIPFHKSGMKMGTVRDTDVKTEDGRIIKGYSGTIDHTKQQTEVWAKANADHKALTKVKNGINIYSFWDFDNKSNLSKNELIEKNLKAYIDACDAAGYLPKFRDYVMNNSAVLNDVLKYSKELGFASADATINDISFEYKGYRIPYGYYKFLGDFGMFKPDGTASPHDTLSLNNYDFDKAESFFDDAESLRRNEILQQFANGEERQKYRDSNLKAEELAEIVKQKRKEVVDEIVAPMHDVQFSLSNAVEETRDLMALHNLQSSELLKTIELGGLPMPSIAVIKDTMSHEQYGDVSLILPKETIDPQTNKDNKVYGGDAWTPTYPRIEYKPNEKVAKKIRDKYYGLANAIGYDEVRPLYNYVNDLENTLNRDGGESAMLEKLYEDTGMMNVYLQDSGKGKVETITNETVTKISEAEAEMHQFFIDALGYDLVAAMKAPEGVRQLTHTSAYLDQHDAEIREAYKRYFMEVHGFTQEEANNALTNATKTDLMKIMLGAYRFTENNGVTVKTETDYEATEKAIRAKAADGYTEWVDGLFKGIEEKSGIRNNQDYYTRSGNPRSWDALHWENTLENVVKVMKEQDDTGVGSFSPFNTLFGASHKQYGSIQDIKADSDRLGKINQDEYDAMKDSFSERFAEIAHSIKDPDERNSFIATDTAAEQIIEAVRTKKTKTGILNHLKALNSRATMQTVDDILSLVSDIANMPTGYFEAKPKRAVSLDEVGVFVIPRNADVKLKQELLNRGYSIAEYDPDVEGDRQRVVNQFEEYKFSLSDAGKQGDSGMPSPVGDYAVYGKDIKYTPYGDIAPVGENVKAESPSLENIPVLPDEKLADGTYEAITPDAKKPAVPKSERIADGSRSDELLLDSLDNHPIQTVEQKIEEKIRALHGEIADIKDLRREKWDDYESRIADLRAKYKSKKNKNTKEASKILQSISRLERMKASDDAEYSKRISDREARIEKMSDPKYAIAMRKHAKMEADAKWAADLLGDTSTWVDKKLGLQYATNTERRNLRDIVRDVNGEKDIARADIIDDALNGRYNQEEAIKKRELAKIRGKYADLKITKAEDAYIQMRGEFLYNPDTTITEADIKEYYEKHKNKIDAEKVQKVIRMARKDYDSLLNRVNAELKKQGMKEIPYRQGYFPHFTEPKQNFIQKLLNWKTQDNEIPTSIAGLTESFKPTKSWQSFDKTRHSDETDYSFMKGFDSYSEGALDWIYHMDTLQKRRAVENHIRFTHSDEGIQARIKEVYANKEMDANEAQAQIEHILTEAKNPLNNFVQDFTTHTNILAGKKNSLDRTVEQWTNRHIYSVMTNVQNRMSANMVLANVRSALTNFIPITQSWAQVSPLRSLQAAKQTIANSIKDDGTVDKSTFLTNRLREADKLYQTNWDKVLDKAGIMFEIVDNFSSQVIWRSKYNQNLADGMSESDAIKNADQFSENVMAGRSKGNEPTLFNAKNPLVKAFTMFQLEVNNQYGYLFKDVPNDLKAETKHWKLNLAKGYTTAFIGAYVYNALFEKLTGGEAALDPIGIIEDLLRDLGLFDDDEEKEPDKVVTNLVDNVVEELPFVGGLFGGGRIPISSALPYSDDGLTGFIGDVSEGNWGNIGKEMMNPLLNVGLPVGGGQLKKTYQGLNMFSDDHPVSGSYTDSGKLRFPVEDTPWNRAQAAIFGQYASKNAREYFDNDYAPLADKQIQEYIDVDIPIKDYWEYREGLKGKTKAEEKLDYISGLDLPTYKKNILANNVLDRKESVDLENYDDFGSLDEFDFAAKNPEKYAFAKSVGGYAAYKTYSSELYDIKADKDASGKSINGSRKEKVIDYINNLDADYYTKIILLKSEYPSDDTYNRDIVEYINNRSDLTYEDRVAILTELGFRVTADGQIYDD